MIIILLECLVEVTDDAVWSWRGFVERPLITDSVSLFDDCSGFLLLYSILVGCMFIGIDLLLLDFKFVSMSLFTILP